MLPAAETQQQSSTSCSKEQDVAESLPLSSTETPQQSSTVCSKDEEAGSQQLCPTEHTTETQQQPSTCFAGRLPLFAAETQQHCSTCCTKGKEIIDPMLVQVLGPDPILIKTIPCLRNASSSGATNQEIVPSNGPSLQKLADAEVPVDTKDVEISPRRAPFEVELVRVGKNWQNLGLVVSPDHDPRYLVVHDISQGSLMADWNARQRSDDHRVQRGSVITAVNRSNCGGMEMLERLGSSGRGSKVLLRIE
eukprot:gnl/TRDRNA2_/TRDRNA2_69874_c0_seq1.p1 gnl/TRDRNA2_/TRDRNA2_69874_c0~~gnl/TRDRNA2_/TRDRNA2_69874_c0_seq1.p1  ORF type:complete len:250 (-),score=52.53 gnl/TRDRNA2_/TRDRNA2_69874_c0_seq1:111-860(-)